MGFSWEGKFQGNFPGDIFLEEVSLDRPNQSFKNSANLSNVVKTHSTLQTQIIQVSANHSTWYKSFNVVKIRSTL